MIVTSSGTNDGGTIETNLHEDRFRPLEGQGVAATWHLSLPSPDLQPFDYTTISDVILHIQHSARAGGDDLQSHALKELKKILSDASNAGLALMFSLRYDFPTEWAASSRGANDKDFTFALRKDYFPFMVQGKATTLAVADISLYASDGTPLPQVPIDFVAMSKALNKDGVFNVTFPAGTFQLPQDVFLILSYGATWK